MSDKLCFYVKNLLSNRTAFNYLIIDILQLTILFYFTGGILNPFIVFLIITSVFASLSLEKKTNYIFLVLSALIFANFFHSGSGPIILIIFTSILFVILLLSGFVIEDQESTNFPSVLNKNL